jgi:hypothetical protein
VFLCHHKIMVGVAGFSAHSMSLGTFKYPRGGSEVEADWPWVERRHN